MVQDALGCRYPRVSVCDAVREKWSPTGGSRAPIESSAGVCRATEIHLSMGRFNGAHHFEWESNCDVITYIGILVTKLDTVRVFDWAHSFLGGLSI